MPAQIIRIRLARHGFKNNPLYHKARDALPLEKLGEYDPIPRVPSVASLPVQSKVFGPDKGEEMKSKRIEWNVERIRWWLKNGAQPSKTVVKLLERVSSGRVCSNRGFLMCYREEY
jgi:small subunit ribosomal protein S16